MAIVYTLMYAANLQLLRPENFKKEFITTQTSPPPPSPDLETVLEVCIPMPRSRLRSLVVKMFVVGFLLGTVLPWAIILQSLTLYSQRQIVW